MNDSYGKWIPVSERLPESCNDYGDYIYYLICLNNGMIGRGYYKSNVNKWYFEGLTIKTVAAWMPLPEPYMESEAQE